MAAAATKKRDVVKFAPNVPVEVALKFAIPGKVISTASGERVMFTLADDRVMFLDLPIAKKIEDLGVNVREKFFVCRPSEGKGDVEWQVWLSPETEHARAKAVTEKNRNAGTSETVGRETQLERQLRLSIDLVKQGQWGEVGDGTFVVPNGASAGTPAPVQADAQILDGHHATNNGNGSTNGANGKGSGLVVRQAQVQVLPPWAESLLGHTDALVDVYAAALNHASTKHGNQVKPEDVRSLLVTVFIQRAKAVSYAA